MIFTLLYNNYKVIKRSLTRLRETNTENYPIVALDNHYPTLTKSQKTRLKNKFELTIIDEGENLGLSGGYNKLIELYPDLRYAILFDCDSNPDTKGWDKALMEVIQMPDISYASLSFEIATREMRERGFTPMERNGYFLWQPKQACVQSISVADLDYLRKIGGLQEPKKYYGGLESKMFQYWSDQNKIVYIDNFRETQFNKEDESDPAYKAYKWEYAHKGYAGSFNEFLKTWKG